MLHLLCWARPMAILALALEAACDTPPEQPAGTPGTPGVPDGALAANPESPVCPMSGCDCPVVLPAPVDGTHVLPDGSTVAELLAMISGSHRAELTWAAPPPELAVSPAPGTTGLVLTATPDPTTVTFGQAKSPFCPSPGLDLSAAIRLLTDDGGLDETWTVHLTAQSSGAAALSSPGFSVDLRTTPPRGSFTVTYTGSEAWDTESLLLTGSLGKSGASGGVTYTTSKTVATDARTASGSGMALTLATWVPSPEPGAAGDAGLDAPPPRNAGAD
jgi:hypothetical protein